MGVSIQQAVVVCFENQDDCERFNNYLERLITKHHVNRTSGFDIDNNSYDMMSTNTPEWYYLELFNQGFDIDSSYIEHDIDNSTVVIDTCGYGTIPEFILGYALSQYNAIGFYLEQKPCQGQEMSNIRMSYDKKANQSQFFVIPDYTPITF